MKIIAHRGAAGIALENSLESFRVAAKHAIDAIEFDVRLTADNHIVVAHDSTTRRIASKKVKIRATIFAELRTLRLRNAETIPTLEETLRTVGAMPVIIDIKDTGMAAAVVAVVQRFPHVQASFASFKHGELLTIRTLLPEAKTYALDHFKPIEIIQNARACKATGIGLNLWLANPLTYKLCQRYGLEMYVYSVNNSFVGWFLHKLYPSIDICTRKPHLFAKFRDIA